MSETEQPNPKQFRVIVGSYEHNLLCLSVDLNNSLFQPIFHFQAHALSVRCLDNSKRYLVSGSNDEHVKIYDLQKRKELGDLLAHQGSITVLKFSSTKWLLSGSEDGMIVVWRVKDWEIFATLKGHKARINDVDVHPSGKIAISCSDDRHVILWNLMTGKKASILKLRGRDTLGAKPIFVNWSENGDWFIVCFTDKFFIYDTKTCKILAIWKFRSTLMKLAIKIVDNMEVVITGHNNGVVNFYKLSTLLSSAEANASAPTEAAKATELIPHSLDELTPEWKFQGHTNRIKDFKFYYNYLVTISSDGKIVIWDLTTKDQIAVYDSGERLTCVTCCSEEVEKFVASKHIAESQQQLIDDMISDYETDNEEELRNLVKTQLATKKKSKKQKKKVGKKISVELE